MNRKHSAIWIAFWCLIIATPPSKGSVAASQVRTDLKAARNLVVRLGTQMHRTGLDCSHFVHALYDEAGLHYRYAASRRLYRGLDRFQRVNQPEPGDLVVWPSHVGIVVVPERHIFLSAIASGVKLSSYDSQYWTKKGNVHFLHYTQTRLAEGSTASSSDDSVGD